MRKLRACDFATRDAADAHGMKVIRDLGTDGWELYSQNETGYEGIDVPSKWRSIIARKDIKVTFGVYQVMKGKKWKNVTGYAVSTKYFNPAVMPVFMVSKTAKGALKKFEAQLVKSKKYCEDKIGEVVEAMGGK